MKVILADDIENLGVMGETVAVSPGYARNYLIPRRLAVSADSASAKQLEHEMRIIRGREEKKRAEQRQLARELEKVTVEIKMRSGEGDKLFGSVTSQMIAQQLADMGYDISRRTIELPEPIKTLGIHTVPVKMPRGIEAQLKVWVTSTEPLTTVVTEPEDKETTDSTRTAEAERE